MKKKTKEEKYKEWIDSESKHDGRFSNNWTPRYNEDTPHKVTEKPTGINELTISKEVVERKGLKDVYYKPKYVQSGVPVTFDSDQTLLVSGAEPQKKKKLTI